MDAARQPFISGLRWPLVENVRWPALCAALLSLAFLAGCTAPKPLGAHGTADGPNCGAGSLYENVDRTFRLCVPLGWTSHPNINGVDVWLATPVQPGDLFQDSVTVTRLRVLDNTTLAMYTEWHETQTRIYDGLHNYTVVSRADGTLAGHPAWRIEYVAIYPIPVDGRVVNATMYWQQIITLHEGVAYVLTYTALAEANQAYLAPFANVVDSFRFTDR